MGRPPAAHDSGEHILDLGARPPERRRQRRDSGDRISFDSIARLVQPSLPPRPYDTLTPVAETDLRPPAAPGAGTVRRPRPRALGLLLRVGSAVAAVALGAGVSAALNTEPAEAPAPVVAGAAIDPSVPAATPAPAPAATDVPATAAAVEMPAVVPTPAAEGTASVAEPPSARAADPVRSAGTSPVLASEERREAARERARPVAGSERAPSSAPGGGDRPPEATAAVIGPPAASTAVEAPGPEPAGTELPEHPSRDQVQTTMTALLPALRGCAAGRNGTVQIQVTAGPSGRIRNALVTGAFAGTPEGSCMARAVRGARFPRFAQDSFTVRYPFRL